MSFLHNGYRKQPGVASLPSRGQKLDQRSSFGGFSFSNARVTQPRRLSADSHAPGRGERPDGTHSSESRSDMNLEGQSGGIRREYMYRNSADMERMMKIEANSDSKVKVTSAFLEYYRKVFDQECSGYETCNLGKLVQALDSEDETTLGLLLNDDLLVSLARSQPKRLLRGVDHSARPTSRISLP